MAETVTSLFGGHKRFWGSQRRICPLAPFRSTSPIPEALSTSRCGPPAPIRSLPMGAQGGNVVPNLTTGPGGLGAEIGGDFTLTAGEILQIAVVAEAEALLSSAQATHHWSLPQAGAAVVLSLFRRHLLA